MSAAPTIRRADDGDAEGLAGILVDCTEAGASVGFMLPLARERALAFWTDALRRADAGERLVLVAVDAGSGQVLGTVQVVFATPENQPHRADISKMLVSPTARRRGIGAQLMEAAESAAAVAGRTLLVLDTASDDATRLYERLGWERVGVIPDYALWPAGGYVDTTVFFKRLS